MALDYDVIHLAFINVAKTQVGSRLSQSGGSPSVIRQRPSYNGNKTPPRPDYPYIAVDITDITEGGGWQANEYIDIDDHTVHESLKQILINYRAYGDGHTPRSIINDLRACFDFHTVRDDLRSSIGAGIIFTGDIDSTPIQLSTKWLESSSFNLIISVVDSQVDLASTIIEQVNLDGGLYDSPDDEAPLIITITVDSTPTP